MKNLLVILVLLLVLLTSTYASVIILFNQEAPAGNTYYISTTGSDSNSCTAARDPSFPKRFFNGASGALACLETGDRLIVRGGTYTEGIPTNTIISGISDTQHTRIEAASGETVIINGAINSAGGATGTTALLWIFGRSFITFQDIIFDCDSASGNCIYLGRAGGFPPLSNPNTPSTYIKLVRCEVRDTPVNSGIAAGYNQDGLVDTRQSFIDVWAHHNGLLSTTPNQSHGLYLTGQNTLVEGGEYNNNSGHGIHNFGHDIAGANSGTIIRGTKTHTNGTQGIGLYDGDAREVYNNIVYGNATLTGNTAAGIRIGLRSTGTKVYGNTVYGQAGVAVGYGIWIQSATNITGTDIKNNIAFSNPGGNINNLDAETIAAGNLCQATSPMCQIATANPLFVNAATRDFHLQAGSPAIGIGADLSTTFTTDYDEQTRTIPFDAGALEFIAPVQSITLSSPASGASWLKTSTQTIAWTTANITNVRIRADRGIDGVYEETITASTPSDGLFDWIPGGTENANVKIEICDASDNTPCAVSATFAITAAAGATITKIISENTTGPRTGDIPGVDDAWIRADFPTTNFGTANINANKPTASTHNNSLISFTGLSQIPDDAAVNSVTLGMFLQGQVGGGVMSFDLRRLLRNWIENQATWNAYSTGNNWTTPGGLSAGNDRLSAVAGTFTDIGTTFQYYTITDSGIGTGGLRDLVQGWVDLSIPNYGFHKELNGAGEDGRGRTWTSSDGTNGNRPFLEVTYTTIVQTITVTQPAPGSLFTSENGEVISIRWQTEGVSGNAKIEISYNGGTSFQPVALIDSYPFAAVDFSWPVTGQTCDQCVVKVTSLNDPSVFGLSSTFSIGSPMVVMY